MAGKMHVAVVEQFGKPLQFQEWNIPAPGPGQILVKTEACGVCHTDLHAATGDWPLKPKLPFIPGHEAIGRRAGRGPGGIGGNLTVMPGVDTSDFTSVRGDRDFIRVEKP